MSRRAGALLAAALIVFSAACGADTVKAQAWAKGVCGAVRPWAQQIQSSVANAQAAVGTSKDPAVVKPQLSKLFGNAVRATDTAIKGVERAGVPDVKDGKQIAKDFRNALLSARNAFATAQKSVQALPTGDKTKFSAAVVRIGAALSKDYGAAGKRIDQNRSAELKAAFEKEPACTR